MKKSKKLFAVLCIILAVTMCLSACGTTPTPDISPTPEATPTPEEPTPTPEESTPTPTQTPTPTPTPEPTPEPRTVPPVDTLVDVTDKVDREKAVKDPPYEIDSQAFDGDPDTWTYWTSQWWPIDYISLWWETTEPITISAYCFENLCGQANHYVEGETLAWELYGVDEDETEILIDIVSGEEGKREKTRLYATDTLQAFSHFRLIITSTNARNDEDYLEWRIGEITLYEDIPIDENDKYYIINDKVDPEKVIKMPLDEVEPSAFDGDPEKGPYWTAYWGWNWEDEAVLWWETTEPVTISAYKFTNFNCPEVQKQDGTKNTWEIYGYDEDDVATLLSRVEGADHTERGQSTQAYYIENPEEFSKYCIVFTDTDQMSNGGNKDKDKWSVGEITLYAEKQIDPNEFYIDISDKVDQEKVIKMPLEEPELHAFDGDPDKGPYWTAYWGPNWEDEAVLWWETVEPVTISAYRFTKFNEGGLLKEDGTKNSWELYGYDEDDVGTLISYVEGANHTKNGGSTPVYVIENPQPFQKYCLVLLDTDKVSGAGNKDKDEWAVGEITLYAAK